MRTRVIQDEPKPDEAASPAPEADHEVVAAPPTVAEPRVAEESSKSVKP